MFFFKPILSRAPWVSVGVRRSKCQQHLYRCCTIFIALLHLLGGISSCVNSKVNCTQARPGTPANLFIVSLTQATSSSRSLNPQPLHTHTYTRYVNTQHYPHLLPKRLWIYCLEKCTWLRATQRNGFTFSAGTSLSPPAGTARGNEGTDQCTYGGHSGPT